VELCPRLEEMTLLFGSSDRKLAKKDNHNDDVQAAEQGQIRFIIQKEQNYFVKCIKNIFKYVYNLVYHPYALLIATTPPMDPGAEIGPFPPQFEGLKSNGCLSLKRF
jgi:hypothetical protein